MINSEDITFVVQGVISSVTASCLAQIRKLFPKSEIILSAYGGCDIDACYYDKLCVPEDPGGVVIDDIGNLFNNINRQIVSTCTGLKFVKTCYCVKTRTDIIIENDKFLNFYEVYNEYNTSEIFKKKVVICNYYTRNPRVMPLPFHPSDWFSFGLTEDLKLFYDVPLQCKSDLRWFSIHHKENKSFYTNILCRFVPEQVFGINLANQLQDIQCENFYDISGKNMMLTEKMFAKEFIILDYQKQLCIKFTKYSPNRYLEKYTLISHKSWKILLKKYSDKPTLLCNLVYIGYISENIIKHLLFLSRTFMLGFLQKTHLKEKVKRFLNVFFR